MRILLLVQVQVQGDLSQSVGVEVDLICLLGQMAKASTKEKSQSQAQTRSRKAAAKRLEAEPETLEAETKEDKSHPNPRPRAFYEMGVVRVLIDATVVILLILLIPGLPPRANFVYYTLEPKLELVGPLAPNAVLDKAEALLSGEITGPESIATRKDEVYTGLIGGYVAKYKDGKISKVVKFGKDCEGKWEEEICGRPLGMRFHKNGKLIVADAYYGIFSVDVDTGKYETLVNSKVPIAGKLPLCPNDLDIAKDGTIYWSDSSTLEHLQGALVEVLAEPSGRFLKYDPKTQQSTVLIEGLHFANGVQLSQNEDFVLVAETLHSRIIKYYLKGAKQGQTELFIDGLPGSPDNIRSDGKGGILVSLIVGPSKAAPILAQLPWVRKFILRITCLIHSAFSFAHSVFPNEYFGKAKYYINHFEPLTLLVEQQTVIVRLDEHGKILGSFQSSGKVDHISEISIDDKREFAYLGSPYNTKLWKVKVADLGI